MITVGATSGTYLNDPTGVFCDVDATITVNSLTIAGTLSEYGTLYPLSGTFAMPAPTTSIQYVSIQVQSGGALNMQSGTSAPALSGGNLIEVFALTIPANAANDEAFSTDAEPTLD